MNEWQNKDWGMFLFNNDFFLWWHGPTINSCAYFWKQVGTFTDNFENKLKQQFWKQPIKNRNIF